MAEKLSWTELRRALAKRAGVSEKTAGAFLNAVQAQLLEALKTDKQVKINGLGTFKVQAVAPRKSVNVTTGEEIIIEGYNKLAFTPEAGVRELIESQESGDGLLNDHRLLYDNRLLHDYRLLNDNGRWRWWWWRRRIDHLVDGLDRTLYAIDLVPESAI